MDQEPTDLARFRSARRFLAAKEAVQRSAQRQAPAESELKIIAEALRADEPDRSTPWPINRGSNVVRFRRRDGRS
jgi:hypothetical protein